MAIKASSPEGRRRTFGSFGGGGLGDNFPKLIKSYGIILFSASNRDGPLFLIYQRRDSYEYIDLIKGAYTTENKFKELVMCLCKEEKRRVLTYSFKDLWDDLWLFNEMKKSAASYERAMRKFERYRPTISNIPLSPKAATNLVWGFPKGRLCSNGEHPIECALREFTEETNISSKYIKVLDVKPFIELYRGSDDRWYYTEYYVAVASYDTPALVSPGNRMDGGALGRGSRVRPREISGEVSNIKWVSPQEACLKLEPRRQIILKGVLHSIESMGII